MDTEVGTYMREIIAQHVSNDKESFNEAILGKPNQDYCDWIRKSSSWGGAIEVSILSTYYGVEIAVVDITNALINRFGEDKEFAMRIFLLFDGIHYDPLYLESFTVRCSYFISTKYAHLSSRINSLFLVLFKIVQIIYSSDKITYLFCLFPYNRVVR